MKNKISNKQRCYITLDYELFLGQESGSIDNCLIIPTHHLCKMLDKYGIKVIFFVDAAYLYKLKELSAHNVKIFKDYIKLSNHIKSLSLQGHSIQLHFHPQWLYSEYSDNKWMIDQCHYRVDDIDTCYLDKIFPKCIDLLNSLIVSPVKAFRAGGYTIGDFKLVKNIFKAKGIVIDSSVLSGKKYSSEFQNYDYSSVPQLSSYSFENNISCYDNEGSFREFPITTMPIGCLKSIYDAYKIKYLKNIQNNQRWGDGLSVISKKRRNHTFISYLKPSYRIASIDGIKSIWLDSVIKYCRNKNRDIILIGHPKLITPFSIQNLEKIIQSYSDISYELF